MDVGTVCDTSTMAMVSVVEGKSAHDQVHDGPIARSQWVIETVVDHCDDCRGGKTCSQRVVNTVHSDSISALGMGIR